MAENTSEVKPTIVTSTADCERIASDLNNETILAIDCQGFYRGSRLKLTLLQIGTYKGDVYLFDVYTNKDLLSNNHLKHLLESENIEKVMFKCEKVSGALYHNFQITLKNVFDIEVAHIMLEEEKKGRKLFPALMLRDVCQVYSSTDKVSKDEEEIMKMCAVESRSFWERKLSDEMVPVAAGHVKALIPEVYEEQKRLLENCGLTEKFKERIPESVKRHIDPNVQRLRKERIKKHVTEILKSIENTCTANTKLQDFEKDSEELLALRFGDVESVQNMSKTIQQLKNEYIDSNLNEILAEVESDQAESLVTSNKLRFLNKTRGHSDKSIAREAGRIRDKIQDIVLSSIERNYGVGSDISLLSTCEQEILRDLPIWSDDFNKFPEVIKDLCWRILENDLDRKSAVLHKYGEKYKLNKYFYYQMEKFARASLSDTIPTEVSEKAKQFLNDIRLYKIDTNFKSRDGSTQ